MDFTMATGFRTEFSQRKAPGKLQYREHRRHRYKAQRQMGRRHRAILVAERVKNKHSVDKQKQADSLAKRPNISCFGDYEHRTGLQSQKLPLRAVWAEAVTLGRFLPARRGPLYCHYLLCVGRSSILSFYDAFFQCIHQCIEKSSMHSS
jgi:hypothetical protein